MTNRKIIVGAFAVSVLVVIGCGDDDDDKPAKDAGADASDDASHTEAGEGGKGGKGGKGGSGGAAGESGEGGSSGGESGAGGEGGEGGAGGEGGGTYSIKGQVTGLSGKGLVLQNNGKDDLTRDDAGEFTFGTKLNEGDDYAVTVKTQPHDPTQGCTVANGTGKVAKADVTNVAITCETGKFVIGGTLATVKGSGLKLKNGTEEITPTGATFAFTKTVDPGGAYEVTVTGNPTGQVCGVAMGKGNANGNVNNIAVTCHDIPALAVEPSLYSAIVWFQDTGAKYTIRATTNASCDIATKTDCADAINVTDQSFSPSGITVPIPTNKLDNVYYFVVIGVHTDGASAVSNKTQTRATKPQLDDSIKAVAVLNNIAYTGGAFTRLSVHTGGVVPVNKITGYPSEIPAFAILDEDVRAVASDGAATNPGYFIGGSFNITLPDGDNDDNNNPVLSRLAHIKGDGSIDLGWLPQANGTVRQIAVNNGTVYVAGSFTAIGATNRPAGAAAINATNAMVSGTWDPSPTPADSIEAIAFHGNDIVLGGSFTNLKSAGTPVARLGIVDPTNGSPLVGFVPTPDAVVNAVAVNADTVYAGGEFMTAGSPSMGRIRLAAFNAMAGTDFGKLLDWNPSAVGGSLQELVYSNNTIYIAGGFTMVASTTKPGLAAIDAGGVGALKNWSPALTPSTAGTVETLAASGDTVYLAGSFTKIGTANRNRVGAVDGNGDVLAWDPNPDDRVESLAIVGNSVVIAGAQRGIRGQTRRHLAAYDADGKPTSWNPNADNTVNAIAASGTTIYVGGDFSQVGNQGRDNLAALNADGTATAWNPDLDDTVNAIAISGTTVYAGGAFSKAGGDSGTTRNRLAAFSFAGSSNGALDTTWDPGATDTVRALAISGTTLYVGGDFDNVGNTARNRAGAVPTTGTGRPATGWNPDVAGATVAALAVSATNVYLGGTFTSLNAAASVRANLAQVGLTDGSASAFAPNPNDSVYALLFVDHTTDADDELFVAGNFTQITDNPTVTVTPRARNHFASFNALTDPVMSDVLNVQNFDQAVRALASAGNNVYAGGDFRLYFGLFNSRYAAFNPHP